MSLQRIFEMVKRQGMPLVVTDGQGRDPVIVLPLDMYEVLLAGQKPENGNQASSEASEPIMVPVGEEVSQPVSDGPVGSSTDFDPVTNGLQKPESESELFAELSTEERFYIETPEDGKLS
jgi:hypothetical protein